MTDFERGYRQGQADYFRWVKTFSGGKPNYVIPPETPEVTPEVTPYVTPDDRGSTGEVPGKLNRDDIIRMAREARMPYFYGTWEIANLDGLERFAKLVAAHERQWVGLTEEEIEPAADQSDHYSAFHHGVSFAEAKLKEKNT